MEQTSFTERLMEFGLTRQEASIYQCLLTEGKVTGYEVAKQTGISRSNAYNSLASMTEKGAAYLVEEASTRKYVPVPLNEFCKNRIRKLEESGKWLQEHMPTEKAYVEGYITIEGADACKRRGKQRRPHHHYRRFPARRQGTDEYAAYGVY